MRHFLKYTLTFLTFNLSLVIAHSQVAINENNNNPDASAMLDISSTDKGLLIPRMDSTARSNIAAPANGLMVYDISTATFWYYDNNKWNEIRNGSKAISYLDIVEDLPEENLDLSCTTEVESVVENYTLSDAVVSGHYMYGVSSSNSRFRIIDISDPMDFKLLADIEVPGNPTELVVAGQYAYLVHNNGTEELSVIDISDHSNPTVGTILDFGLGQKEIAVAGNYLYVVDNFLELYFLDISNPSVPTIVNSIKVDLQPDDLAVNGGYAYVIGEDIVLGDELRVVDISSVSNPCLVDTLPLGSSPRNILTDNGYAYISDFTDEEIRIVDLADPSNLSTINTISLSDRPREIAIANNYLFSTGLSGTFEIIDVSDPLNTNIEANLSVLSAGNGLNIAGSNAIVNGGAGFNIIPITPCDLSYLAVNGFSGELYAVEDNTVFISQNGITSSVNNEDDFVFGANSLNYDSGIESKMYFDKSKGSFRVGGIADSAWDQDNTGAYSFATGFGTTASSFGEVALGSYNTAYQALDTNTFNSADRLLVIGNGTSETDRSDVLSVYKNGNVGIGLIPTARLSVNLGGNGIEVLDANNTSAPSLYDDPGDTWQSYTALNDGILSRVELEFRDGAGNRTVSIYKGEGTNGAIQGTVTADISDSGIYFFSFDFSATHIEQITGEVYTIAIDNKDRLFLDLNGSYSGGREKSAARDLSFKVYSEGVGSFNAGSEGVNINDYTFPQADGSVNQLLATNGNGTLDWVNPPTFTDTDNQTIDKLNLNGTTLELSIEDDGEGDQTVNLAALQDDLGDHIATQNIQLSGSWLSNDGGNEGIRIDNDGNVGIGSDIPESKLEIKTTVNSDGILLRRNSINDASGVYYSYDTNTGYEAGIQADRDMGGSNNGGLQVIAANNRPIQFYVKGGQSGSGLYDTEEVMRVNGNGQVGIGTNSPGALLDLGDASGSNTVLLRLNTERSWQFEQSGNGVNSSLHLKSSTAGKNYNIVSSDGSVIASFRADGNSNNNVGINKIVGTNDNALEVNGNASKSTAGDWLANSDARLKKNIKTLNSEQALEQLLTLQGITYEWNDDQTGNERPEGIQYGFTAQNIQEVFPTLVSADSKGYLQTSYGTYDAMHVEALRALNEKIEKLESENEVLKVKIAKINQLEAMLEALQMEVSGGSN